MYEDLGNEHRINEVLDKLAQGYLVPGVQAFTSCGPSQHASPHQMQSTGDSSTLLKSSKNLQMQVTCNAWLAVSRA